MLSVLNYLISEELFPSVKEFVCPYLQIKCLKLPWDKADLFKNLKTRTIPLDTHGCVTDLNELHSWLWKTLVVPSLFNLVGAAVEGLWGCSLKSHLPPVNAIYKPFMINTLRWDLEGPKWQVGGTSSGFIALTTAPDVPSSAVGALSHPNTTPMFLPLGSAVRLGWPQGDFEMGFKQLWSLAHG